MASPAAWTQKVALNCLRRALRRKKLEYLRHRPNRIYSPTADGSDAPELWAAVRTLPSRQRRAVVLRYVADLPEAEIAEAMGITRGTVASTLAAARSRLATLLADDQTHSTEVFHA